MIYCKYPSSSLTIYSHFYRKLNLFIKFPSCTYPGCYIVYPKMKKKIIKYYCCSKYFKRYTYQKNKNKKNIPGVSVKLWSRTTTAVQRDSDILLYLIIYFITMPSKFKDCSLTVDMELIYTSYLSDRCFWTWILIDRLY